MKFFLSNYRRWFAFMFFVDFVFHYPFYNLMFSDSGVGQFGISFLIISMQASKMFFDVPVGYLSDRYGRKKILIIGQVVKLSFLLLFSCFKNYFVFCIGMFCWGFAMSTVFSNIDGFIYEFLKRDKKEVYFPKLLGYSYTFQSLAISLGSFISGFIFQMTNSSYSIIFLCSAISTIFAIYFIVSCPDLQIIKEHFGFINMFGKIRKVLSNVKVKILFITHFVNEGLFFFSIDLMTLMMIHYGFLPKRISFFVSLFSGLKIFGNFIAGYISNYINLPIILIINFIFTFFIFIFNYNVSSVGIFFVGLIYICYSFIDVALKQRIQSKISSDFRSTIASLIGFCGSLFTVFLNLTNGLLSVFFDNHVVYILISLFLSLLFVTLFVVRVFVGDFSLLKND